MNNTIWKFPLDQLYRFPVNMPRGARPMCVQMQGEVATLWALVDPSQPIEQRYFGVYGTGWELPNDLYVSNYIGTFQRDSFVWHVFDFGGAF